MDDKKKKEREQIIVRKRQFLNKKAVSFFLEKKNRKNIFFCNRDENLYDSLVCVQIYKRGKVYKKCFSIMRYGVEEAYEKAAKERTKMFLELF